MPEWRPNMTDTDWLNFVSSICFFLAGLLGVVAISVVISHGLYEVAFWVMFVAWGCSLVASQFASWADSV
jgi:hypothetical protein